MPALEAHEHLADVLDIGAALGAERGRQYVETLFETAWWDDPRRIEKAMALHDAASADKGIPVDRPDGNV